MRSVLSRVGGMLRQPFVALRLRLAMTSGTFSFCYDALKLGARSFIYLMKDTAIADKRIFIQKDCVSVRSSHG
jgi:hypothetical protein